MNVKLNHDRRAEIITLIHVAKADLKKNGVLPDDDDYRLLLANSTASKTGAMDGKTSAADMSIDELDRVVVALRAKGFKIRHKKIGKKTGRPLAGSSQTQKLRAIWLDMANLGIVRDPSEEALCSWASNSRSSKITALLEAFDFAMTGKTIERLKKWRIREMVKGQFYCPECNFNFPPESNDAFAKHWPQVVCMECYHPNSRFDPHPLSWRALDVKL